MPMISGILLSHHEHEHEHGHKEYSWHGGGDASLCVRCKHNYAPHEEAEEACRALESRIYRAE